MIVEDTILNKNNIKKLLKKYYGYEVIYISKINRGSANIYKIKTKDNIFVLKEFQSKISKNKIELEYDIFNFLDKYTVKTPQYIKTIKGDIYFKYKNKYIILQKYINGYTVDFNSSTRNQILESIMIYSKLINVLEKFDEELEMFKKHEMNEAINKETIKLITNFQKKNKNIDINKKLEIKKEFLKNIKNENFTWIEKLTYKNSHGDYNVSQFILNNSKIDVVLDFVSAKRVPVSREIIRNYFFMAKEIKEKKIDIAFFIEYVKEYMKTQKLNRYDLIYMPLIYLIELSKTIYGYEHYLISKNKECIEYGDKLFNQFICLKNNYYKLVNELKKIQVN